MTTQWPVSDPQRTLRTGVDELAAAARASVASENRPLQLRLACEAAFVRVVRRPLAVGARRHTAMLVPTLEGFRAVVDSDMWERAACHESARRRLRFILCHELGHTFFYRPGRPPTRSGSPDRAEERLCHRFATSLLVPRAAALQAPRDPGGLFALAKRYDVSVRVAAWAVVRAEPSIALLWLHRAPHPVRGGDEAMRVQWSASERFVAVGESFKSPLADLAPGDHGHSIERLRLGGRAVDAEVDAWRFDTAMLVFLKHCGSGESASVVRQRADQLTLF